MRQYRPRLLLDSVKLMAVLAAAGTAVLFWMPVLVVWTTLAALRHHVPRRARPSGNLSPIA